jgi:hypothetical protein
MDQTLIAGCTYRFGSKRAFDPTVDPERSEGEDLTAGSRSGLSRVPLFHLVPTPETNSSLPFTFAPSLASARATTAAAPFSVDDPMMLTEAPTPLLPAAGPHHDVTSLNCNEHMGSGILPSTSSYGLLKRRRLFESMDRPVHGTGGWVSRSIMSKCDGRGTREGTPEEDGAVAAALHDRLMNESVRSETPEETSAALDGSASVAATSGSICKLVQISATVSLVTGSFHSMLVLTSPCFLCRANMGQDSVDIEVWFHCQLYSYIRSIGSESKRAEHLVNIK